MTNRRASGTFESTGLYGELTYGETLQCVHCQYTRILTKGSGKVWGFCTNCMGYHCDKPDCQECLHFMRRVENIEAGRPELTPAPAMILVPPGIDDIG